MQRDGEAADVRGSTPRGRRKAGRGVAGDGADAVLCGASFDFERRGIERGHRIIAGVDEAGRGPWAGPVVAAAVILDAGHIPCGIADSKQLAETKREALFEELLSCAKIGVGFADPERIDRDNILAATMWAMQRAVLELCRDGGAAPDLVLVDGNRAPVLACEIECIVKGDALSLSIAAASIVAKVSRDRMMRRFDAQFPGFGFGRHKGYGTAAHRSAIERLGLTPLHRRSFKPVREALEAAAGGSASGSPP